MIKINFSVQIIVASVLGLLCGVIFKEQMANLNFIGEIFLRLIQMSVVILIMGAIIESVGSLNPKDFGKIGVKAIFLFACTTIISSVVGIFVVNIIKPGVSLTGIPQIQYEVVTYGDNLLQLVVNFVPKNIFESMSSGNLIQVIIFSIFFGLAISNLKNDEKTSVVYDFIVQLNKIIMEIIKYIMKFAPIGVFALLGSITGSIGIEVVIPLFKFLLSMFLGAFIIFLIHLTVAVSYAKVNPFVLMGKLKETALVSVTTTSSAISLPIQMNDCETKLGISVRISRLVNSLAMTLNSDGLALTISIACIMVAQFYGIELSIQQQVVIVSIATLTTVGNLLVPGGALVAISLALGMAGLPLEGIALFAGVDWFA
ncbi:MAG TPA: dicarboxylate/amino acid:cation symporter, partial [Fusibacter sp.]|nr:dicarboxylate/amino acid:cation symporter [Fusibacter sp.]